MIAPAVIKLKTLLQPIAPYKDKRGMWFIHIYFHNSSVTICHKKWEESFPSPKSIDYSFRWELELHFNKQMTDLSHYNLYIPELVFGPDTATEQKQIVLNVIRENLTHKAG